ncbi:uncharacterized protein [Panulirus ornatus]|uniref:uncharacterized protein n=1 Tax=Panulirus ornatus TaxID=150431 RepID=UPI003A85F3CC
MGFKAKPAKFQEVLSLSVPGCSSTFKRDAAANLVRVRNLAFRAGLSVETVNGVDVLRVEKRGLLLSATSFRSSMIFAQSVVVDGDVRAANINGVLASAYVTLSDPFVLSRPMAFQNAVSVSGRVAVVSTVNKVDLQAFSRSVALTTAASQVFSSVAFVSVAAQSVECEVGQVAGVLVSDWVLLNQTAVITGEPWSLTSNNMSGVMGQQSYFSHSRAKRLKMGGLGNPPFLQEDLPGGDGEGGKVQVGRLTADLINDVNVNSFFLDSLRKNPAGPQVVHGNMQLKQLVVEQELTTQGFTLTRLPTRQTTVVDLKRLSRKVVYKDQTSTISGGILLNGGASVSTLNFFDSFDGVPATRYDEGWLLKSSPQTIIGHLTLPSMTAGDVLIVPGVKVQGVDILNLKNTTAMVDEPVVISSSVRFAEMVSLSEVYVAGLVQGWDLSEDGILQNSSSVVFTSSKTFLSSISISQRFQAVRGISGLDLDALCRQIQVDSLTIIGTVRLAARVTAGIVQVEDHVISGESVTDYWLTDQSILLPQPIALQEVFANHVVVKGTINGVDLVSLSTRLLQNTCRDWQVLTGRLSINELAAYTLSTPEVLARTLNGHPVTDLSNIFTLDGDQVIRGHWIIRSVHVFGNVESTDLVNGMRMTDLCQLRRPCVIHATKTFSEDVVVLGHHYVQDDRTVQGVDVSEAFKYIVSRTSCGEIPGVTTFSGGLALSSILVHGLVDGVKVTADNLLTRSGNQVMTGLLVITYRGGDVVTAKQITAADGLFNGLDLTLLNQVFRLDVANTVKSPVVFLIGVVFRDLSYGPHVKSTNKPLIDLSDLRRCASAYESLYNLGSRNYWAVKNQFRELWGWRRVQKFEGTTKRIQPLRMDDVEDGSSGMAPSYSQYLAVIPKFGNTRILVYSATKDQYQDLNIVVSGRCIRNVVGYRTRQYDYVVTGHACQYLTQATYGANYTSLAVQPDQMLQVWKITSQALLVGNIPIRGAADVQVLRLRGVLCLVVVEAWGPDTVILCEQGPDNFVEHQRLPTGDPRKVAVAHHRGPLGRMGTFLVVAGWGYTPQEHSAFTVWTYDAEVDLFLLMQSVSFDNVEWVEMVSHGEDLFLVVVSKGFRGEVKGEVDIYRMDWFSDDDYTPFATSALSTTATCTTRSSPRRPALASS